ncbi:MAG: 3-hydroxyacyl-CoA dehydrogenase NAD-binding domain-containing protein [Bacteroidota bacterium]|nr:3-hydroxyacyl-CoA dehydrogenase NAD-binding domain-containing protein [Bacteroidota bacterium]
MNRKINKVSVLGSGIMGSRIACHFANIGVEVMLLDMVPRDLTEDETQKGLTLELPEVRNRIVNQSLASAVQANPSPLYHKSFLKRIKPGNFEDNLPEINSSDWVIEVVVENLEIKRQLFEKVEKFRRPGTLITSNTSGIPIHLLAEGRSEDFQKHLCGTHFFNPPRYLRLLEIIPQEQTNPEVIDFLMHYGDLFLGKSTVLCKDTPAFIANRIGIYSILEVFQATQRLDLSVEQVDKLTGPVIGRPKSATFRTIDIVGFDTVIKVANNLFEALKDDESVEIFKLGGFPTEMEKKNYLGDKTGQGFYKKTINEKGEKEILSLNLKTMEYGIQQPVKFKTLEASRLVEDVAKKLTVLLNGKDEAAEFYRSTFFKIFCYVSSRIPEISDDLYRIDAAMCAGFGWDYGPFETWDMIGLKKSLEQMESTGNKPATWVYEMIDKGMESFYKIKNGIKNYYDIETATYKPIPGYESFIILNNLRENKTVWSNEGASIIDIGDGVLNLEFQTKMNTIGSEVIQGLNKAIDIAEKDFRGLVIGNDGPNFSAGANLALLLMYAIEQEFDEIDMMVRAFQNTMMRIKYSSVPVVGAPHGLTLGGGCELNLHVDAVQAAAETYIGLVEFGVGLIPAGGGTKEMTLRASDRFEEGDIELNNILNSFMNIGMAKVATSAYEAFDMGILRKSDRVSINPSRLLADAKERVIELSAAGYTKPIPRSDIRVLGKDALSMFYIGAHSMETAHFISEHDKKISGKLAYIMSGGDLSYPQNVTEQYLLDLEREAFLSLCGERKTLERIEYTLKTGNPLRN